MWSAASDWMLTGCEATYSNACGIYGAAALLAVGHVAAYRDGKVDRKALLELESQEAREEAGSLALTPTKN